MNESGPEAIVSREIVGLEIVGLEIVSREIVSRWFLVGTDNAPTAPTSRPRESTSPSNQPKAAISGPRPEERSDEGWAEHSRSSTLMRKILRNPHPAFLSGGLGVEPPKPSRYRKSRRNRSKTPLAQREKNRVLQLR